MKTRVALTCVFLLYGLGSEAVLAVDDLGDLRWGHRVILVDEGGPDALDALRAHEAAIEERDVIWFVKRGDRVVTNYPGEPSQALIDDLNAKWFARYPYESILIGKDGGIKSRDAALDLQDYFDQIDAMPMRRREMRQSGRSR